MSFIQLSDIPFKKLPHSYVADLGDIRLVVNDEALLVKDAYSHINPISGVQQNFEYYLKLPLKAKLNDIGSTDKLFELVADSKSVLNICQQQSDYSGSVGSIGQVVSDSRSTHRDVFYTIKQRGSLNGNGLSTLSGIICIDTFTEIPSYFVTKVNGNVIINNISYSESLTIIYGVDTSKSPYDSFSADNEAGMLALTIKLGDRCYRTDLLTSFINVTGANDAISDWANLGGGGDGISEAAVQAIVATHSNIITGNPHQVTKADVGLANVPNTDFTDEIAALQTLAENSGGLTVDQLSVINDASAHIATIVGNPHQVTKVEVGLGNVPNVDLSNTVNLNTAARHTHSNKNTLDLTTYPFTIDQANAISANTLKVGITPAQANAIVANSAKVGITQDQADAIVANTAKVGITPEQADAIVVNSAKVGITPDQASAIVANSAKVGITPAQASAIIANSDKVGITQTQADAIVANSAKVGITPEQIESIIDANAHVLTITGNPHQVTKADIGLSLVPNHDFTAEVNANTAKVGITPEQAVAIVNSLFHSNITSGNPHQVSKIDIGLGDVPDTDFTNDVNLNNIHRLIISGNPHQVTKAEVGLALVPNTDFTAEVAASVAHIATIEGNPHNVTKAEIGLGNVPNVDCTNASNITTGTLPSSVLPALAITDSFVVNSEVEQLALTVEKGDIAIRTDLKRSFINKTNSNLSMADWQELMTPTDTVLTVNGQTGIVVLTSTQIAEGSNLYYTEARVSANANVSANTAARHTHDNKAILDATTASFTTEQAAALLINNSKIGVTLAQIDIINEANVHNNIVAGNPHQVTKVEVGLGNVPNHDFTTEVAANTAKVGITSQQANEIILANQHRAIITGNPHQVTKDEIGLSNVPNTDFTTQVTNADAHIATIEGNPHQVTKADIGLSLVPNHDFTTEVNANTEHSNITVGNPHQVTKADVGLGLVPNHDFTAEVNANTAKVGITPEQAAAIVANSDHTTITVGNPHNVTKADVGLGNVPNVDFTSAIAANTAAQHNHANDEILNAITSAFTTEQAAAIVANSAKVGITPEQANAILINTNKVGITDSQIDSILTSETHTTIITGNPHQVTKTDVGLGNVPNVDFTSAIAANTTARHTHVNKAILDAATASFTTEQATAIVANSAKVGITPAQASAIVANSAKVGITVQQIADIVSANAHRAIVTGNPHQVTKADVGLDNVPNVDCTNASNITTGTLPSSVLPPLAIIETFVVASETEQLALTVQKGDVAIRTDSSKTYINVSGNNTALSDWQELSMPLDIILSVNGKIGTVILTTTDITEGTNLYYTDSRVSANIDVAANTVARHTHANKAILDTTTASFTSAIAAAIVANSAKVGITSTQADAIITNTAKVGITPAQAASIISSEAHSEIITGNPHQVTKAEVGLSQVPNVDFTSAIAANTAAQHNHTNKTILDAVTASFTTEQANAIIINTDKVGITPAQASAIIANSAKVGITSAQATAIINATAHSVMITGNPHQVTKADVGLSNVPNMDFTSAVTLNSEARHTHANKAILDATTASFTSEQSAAIVANSAKVGITPAQADAIIANTAKVGITPAQITSIETANAHILTITGNPHSVTKAEVGLGNVPNHDFTAEVNANSAKVGITTEQSAAILINSAKIGITTDQIDIVNQANIHISTTSGNPHQVTKAEVGLSNVPNTDFTTEMQINNAKVGITSQQAFDIISANTHREIVAGNPHNVTKTDVGLSNVPNIDFTTAINNATTHISTITSNPHQVTKADVGLSNVPNVDCTNASNITTGTLPSSVLPALAITETYVVISETEQLALDVQKGDIAVRTDINRSFINKTSINESLADWQELMTPTDTILTVNGQIGTVVLTTSNINEGTNLYYTEARVSANSSVAANTAARHTHANKAILDATTASFTSAQASAIVANSAKVGITPAQASAIVANTSHSSLITGNPHHVTKADVGLNNVPNTDFTSAVNNSANHISIITGNPHQVTKTEVGLGNVPNTDFTSAVAANTAHRALTTGNPHNVTKADVGLSNVQNVDLTGEVSLNTTARHTHSNKAALDLVVGENTGDQTNITGNAGTATKLANPVNINGVPFDGSAGITIPAGDVTLTGIQTLTRKTLEAVILSKGVTEGTYSMPNTVISAANGSILTKALSANSVFTDSLSNGQSVTMILTNGNSYTVTWPTITWVSYNGNVAPLIYENNLFVFWKVGTTLYGTFIGSF